MKNKIFTSLGVVLFASLFFAVLPVSASAAVKWNDNSLKSLPGTVKDDCPTIYIGDSTTGENATGPCWGTSVTNANPGDTIKIGLFYHNTGDSASPSTMLSATGFSGSSNNFTISGTVSGGGASDTKSVSLHINGAPQTLSYTGAVAYDNYGAASSIGGSPSGYNVGYVDSWKTCPTSNVFCHSGVVIMTFRLSNNVTASNCAITDFHADHSSVNAGDIARLSWSTSNCTSVTVNNAAGPFSTSGTNVPTYPINSTTVFTLTASGPINTDTKSLTITVGSSSACVLSSFSADNPSINSGSSTTLRWSASNCQSLSISGGRFGSGTPVTGISIDTGVLTTTTNYILTAIGVSGDVHTLPVTVTVNAASAQCQITNFYTTPTAVSYGASSTLYWNTSNCTQVSVTGPNFTNNSLSMTGGISTGPIYGTSTYTITANGPYNTAPSQTTTVTISSTGANCSISNFYASPSNVISGASAMLYWNTNGCTNVTVSGPGVWSNLSSGPVSTGPIYGTNIYTISASGPYNTAPSQTVTVTTNTYGGGQCYVNNFYAAPVNVAYGGTATIYWNVSGNANVTISGPGIYQSQQYSSGQISTGPIYSNATYTLYANCYDGSGNSVNRTLTIYTNGQQQNTDLTPITTVATNITTSSARLNGLIPAASQIGSVSAYFEYGPSSALGYQTSPQTVYTSSAMNYFDTVSLSAGTTYYYRAALTYNGQIYRGQIVPFTTVSVGTVVPPVVISTGGGSGVGFGSPLVSLAISDQFQSAAPGDFLNYVINYKNISNQTLSNVVLNVILPDGVTFRQSTQGVLTTNNTVVANLGTLPRGAEGVITIGATVNQSVVPGSTLVATATLAFTTPSGAQDSAVAYDIDTVTNRNALAGLALFGGGFFPGTLLGWILLLALIIIIILLVRHYYGRRPAAVYYNNSPYTNPAGPAPAPGYHTSTYGSHPPENLPH